jgi:hypothetical protein
MAENIIKIELSAEDRKLLNEITTGLTVFSHLLAKLTALPAASVEIDTQALAVAEKATEQANITPEPEKAPETPTEAPQTPVNTEPTPEPVKAAPSVDLAQIQQKVVQLCASGEKKAAVRAVINEYGAKVSDLKDQPEKWDEVWAKLAKIEREG